LADYEIGVAIRRSETEFPSRKRLAEALGLSRAGLYQFLAFEALPDFIKRDLDIQPRLLGGTAAQAIAASIKKHGEEGMKAAIEIWPLVVKGEMDQGKAAPAITALATRQTTPAATSGRSIDKFFAGKEHAGSITKDISNFTVKIKTGIITEAQEIQIRQLIGQMFQPQPKAS
jgi:ParB family chromosome partitioning protein